MANYLDYCQYQKRLDTKTLKAYRIDLNQAAEGLFQVSPIQHFSEITPAMLEEHIYTHVAMAKQKDILTTKHPRKDLKV